MATVTDLPKVPLLDKELFQRTCDEQVAVCVLTKGTLEPAENQSCHGYW